MFKNLALGLTFIVATNAAGNASLPEGTITCDFNSPGTEVKQECPFYMACTESKNKTWSGCVLKGNTVCNLHRYLGETGDIVSNNLPTGCHPTESCCDGQCCSELQVCEELQGPSSTTFMYDYTVLDVVQVARNDWKTPNGKVVQNRPRVCIDKTMSADSASKAVLTPIFALAILSLVTVEGFRRASSPAMIYKIGPAIIAFTGFFLMLSQGWIFALMTQVVASATMACPRSKKGLLILGQLMFLWVYFGGVINVWFGTGNMKNFFQLAQSKVLEGSSNSLVGECTSYYDFYNYAQNGNDKAWNADPTRSSWGLCAREYLGFLVVMSHFNAFAVFTMITHTFHEYLSPVVSDDKTTETTNPLEAALQVNP